MSTFSPSRWLDASAIPERLLWQEGDLLTQQHFQEERNRLELLLAYRLCLQDPNAWGVAALEIDHLALADGRVRIERLSAIMPDGMLVSHPSLGCDCLEIDVSSLDVDLKSSAICLHLAVAAKQGQAREEVLRYRLAGSRPVADEMTGRDPIELERMVPELSLIASQSPKHPPANRFVSLPLVELRVENEALVQTDYLPPPLYVNKSHSLGRLAADLAAELRCKAQDGSRKLNAALGAGDSGATQQSAGWDWSTIQALAAGLPRLEAIIGAAGAPSFQLYLALCDIAGALACLNRQILPNQLPVYDHRDARRAYLAVIEQIKTTLDHTRESYDILRFERIDESHFSLAADAFDEAGEVLLGIRIGKGQAAAAVASWLEGAVIASGNSLGTIRQARSRGAERRRVDAGEELWLTPPPDVIAFTLKCDPRFIRPNETLEIIGVTAADANAPAEILAYQPHRQASQIVNRTAHEGERRQRLKTLEDTRA